MNPDKVRKQLSKIEPGAWTASPWGADGWRFVHGQEKASVMISCGPTDPGGDPTVYIHASIARRGRMPSYADLAKLHRIAFGDLWAYQVFAPKEHHVNIAAYALHLWGRADGQPMLPNFGAHGTI